MPPDTKNTSLQHRDLARNSAYKGIDIVKIQKVNKCGCNKMTGALK